MHHEMSHMGPRGMSMPIVLPARLVSSLTLPNAIQPSTMTKVTTQKPNMTVSAA